MNLRRRRRSLTLVDEIAHANERFIRITKHQQIARIALM
jgi:hypothetical protein